MQEESLEPACRITPAQRVGARRGWQWWRESIELLSVDTERWIVAVLLLMGIGLAIAVVCSFLPYVGDLINGLLMPVFSVGFLYLVYRVLYGYAFAYGDVLIGLRYRTTALLLAGAAQVGLQIMAGVVFFLLVTLFDSGASAGAGPASAVEFAQGGRFLAVMVTFFLLATFFYLSAVWFQPALVFFGESGPVQALKQSFRGVWINWRAFALYGLVGLEVAVLPVAVFLLLFSMVGAFTAGLVAVLLYVLIGIAALATGLFFLAVMGMTTYMAFRDIYGLEADTGRFL
ncbi:BPSS1780 family membrane protein [Salinisphaera sp.]|uniref:BPSS1780 family membrane protein n=1 Tax=Salinisphaera sp. TaxID=1914330 RepID=UPI000C3DE66E|nr:BPSS1780 family membrane protein [Salinisphaera sp.]MBS61497.1 hypothetical protein [Salinisphaera sp.]